MYRTSPLAGLWTHQKGGFFHDGRFATFLDVVNHYDTQFNLNLSDANKRDLVEYLKGISDPKHSCPMEKWAKKKRSRLAPICPKAIDAAGALPEWRQTPLFL